MADRMEANYDVTIHFPAVGNDVSQQRMVQHQSDPCGLHGADSAVDGDMWNGMKPEGFACGNDRNSYQDDESAAAFTLGSADPADACITRVYSSANEQEGRATLIEYILRPDAPGSAAENFTDFPILQAKLDYLTELVRPVFGYVYREEILKQR